MSKEGNRQHHHYQLSESQSSILGILSNNPGIRYKELARQTGMANGVLTYHLNILDQIGFINKFKQDKITRYYPVDIPKKDLKIISHLRVRSERDIILFMLEQDSCTFSEIVEHLGKAPSTISWHLKRLCSDGIVEVHYGEYNIYRIVDEKSVNEMLHKYNESLTDKVVNNFIEMTNEL